MKVLGKRVSILKKDDLLSIVILPTTDKRKLGLLFLWLMAWTVCGIIVFANYFKLQNKDAKLFIIIYLSFWAYFEVKIMRAFLWKRFGKEKIWIKAGFLNYQREINKRGKVKDFDLELITDLKLIELHHSSWSDTINQSFWIKGGERLQFQCQAKTVTFGMQLTDEEARGVLQEIKQFIKKQ
ncbi:MAG: hypothetical protein QM534_15545 [Sediminibacterium sp.]|nr:hypothetical protein [Sediminibacterium sp.]